MSRWSPRTIFELIAEHDPFHIREEWGDLRARIGDRVTTTVIEDASHALFPEQPDAVAEAVISYLAHKPASPTTAGNAARP